MSHVVVVAGARRFYRRGIPALVQELEETGAVVHAVVYGAAPAVTPARGTVVSIPTPAGRGRTPPAALAPVVTAWRTLTRRRAVDHFRRGVLRSAEVAALLEGAAVLVALDAPGIEVAWHVARRHPRIPAVVGVAGARQVLARAQAPEGPA